MRKAQPALSFPSDVLYCFRANSNTGGYLCPVDTKRQSFIAIEERLKDKGVTFAVIIAEDYFVAAKWTSALWSPLCQYK